MGSSKQNKRNAATEEARFFNRDVSWLEFNRRVLAQAADERMPLLERLRFLAIFTSNLDEFFMKRVGLVKRQVHAGVDIVGPDGMTPRQALNEVRELSASLQQQQVEIFQKQLVPALEKAGIQIVSYAQLTPKEVAWADDWYRTNVFPALTPLAVNPTHRFPFISNLSDNVGILATMPDAGNDGNPMAHTLATGNGQQMGQQGGFAMGRHAEQDALFARLKIPPTIKHFVPLPTNAKSGLPTYRILQLQDLIRHNLDDLFPGMKLEEQILFRVTRSAGIQKDDLDAANLLQSIEADLKQRKFARVVRLEIEPDPSPRVLHYLLDKLNLDRQDVYERPAIVDFSALNDLADLDRPDLRHKPWKAVIPPRLADRSILAGGDKNAANYFAQIRKQDILVHHPYESFNASVERFIAAASADPDVVTIKQTLYRTSPDSPFVESLIRAAEAGKQVACLVELRARFDENRNVRFARQLEKAGVHVAYGVMGLKTHCKTSLVVRKEKSGLRCYAHLGTGNYHPKTAQLYTDLGLLTCDPDVTGDLVSLFNYLTGLAATQKYETLLVAPFTMRQRFYAMIDREIGLAKQGLPATIMAKVNSMEDREITEKLYEASQAGVKITIVCRGFCCLRPGVKGLSENIRVISVVGRFLEHSRIFYFGNGALDPVDGDWYIGSADWMYRNLSNRVEVAVPVRDDSAKRRLIRLMEIHQQDHRNAWDLHPNGTYTLRTPPADADQGSAMVKGTFETLMWDAIESSTGS